MAGGSVSISGAGFDANELVSITGIAIGDDGGDRVVAGAETGASGAFAVDAGIDHDIAPGAYTLRARGSNGNVATAALVVVAEEK